MIKKTCLYCGIVFEAKTDRSQYCSPACSKAHRSFRLGRNPKARKTQPFDRHGWMTPMQRKQWEARQKRLEELDRQYAHIRKPTKCHWRSNPSREPMPYGELA